MYMKLATIYLVFTASIDARSAWRTQDTSMPEISCTWSDDPSKSYTLKDYWLEFHPIFSKFDRPYFMDHLLPDEPLVCRRSETTIDGAQLKKLANELLVELAHQKKEFKHFKVLKSDDFNFRKVTGLIIFKYKEHPFVLKLFIKTPETFVKPFSEGLYPRFFFRMGGGINRHLSGFTRIRNLEEIKKRVEEDPEWAAMIETPRKWFWLPEQPRWITIRSKNIGPLSEYDTEIPATYGIICDEIVSDKTFSLLNKIDRDTVLDFAHYIGNRVDAHATNYMIEKDSGKMVLIDTEHFPTMIGLKEPLEFEVYSEWYVKLSIKCLKDTFLRDKQSRRALQAKPTREVFAV
jgi:hypothetical protein